jgi:hypothetical protein
LNFDCCGEVLPTDCIDLKRQFGMRYKIGWEDPAFRGSLCPWHYVILCKHGQICPAGGTELWACSITNLGARLLRELTELEPNRFPLTMDGSDGVNISLDVKDVADVALVLKALRR